MESFYSVEKMVEHRMEELEQYISYSNVRWERESTRTKILNLFKPKGAEISCSESCC